MKVILEMIAERPCSMGREASLFSMLHKEAFALVCSMVTVGVELLLKALCL